MVNFAAENDASLYFFCLILHNEESQENENNIFFFKKKSHLWQMDHFGREKDVITLDQAS